MASQARASASTFTTNSDTCIDVGVIPEALGRCYIFALPNELLAELAIWLSHPTDLLSLAMTSKRHYQRLTGPGVTLLWKRTRAVFEPQPVPDPPVGLTEIAWATWLFGPHACAECGRKTFTLPFSFRLRLHFCKTCSDPDKLDRSSLLSSYDSLCRETEKAAQGSNELSKESIVLLARKFANCVPQLESERCRTLWGSSLFFSFLWDSPDETGYSTKAWQAAIAPIAQAADPGVALKEAVDRLTANEPHPPKDAKDADRMLKWSLELQKSMDANEAMVTQSAKSWAEKESLEYHDLQRSQVFRDLWSRTKRRRLSNMDSLLSSHRTEVLSQTHKIHESRARASQALSLQKRQQEMTQYYAQKIVKQKCHPNPRVFRSLPGVKSLIQDGPNDFKAALKISTIQELLNTELETWLNRTVSEVRVLLNYAEDASGEEGIKAQPPEEWCTSLFVCSKCRDVEGAYKRAGVMDFRGLCAHECKEKHSSRKQKTKWAVANFEVARKARDVIRTMLDVAGLNIADAPSNFLFDVSCQNERAWSCGNCEIEKMSRQDLVRHCSRHNEQRISREPIQEQYTASTRPFSYSQIASGKFSEEARKKRFQCAHCHQRAEDHIVRRAVMDFNGMRSHLKAKHGILDVRNADFSFTQQ